MPLGYVPNESFPHSCQPKTEVATGGNSDRQSPRSQGGEPPVFLDYGPNVEGRDVQLGRGSQVDDDIPQTLDPVADEASIDVDQLISCDYTKAGQYEPLIVAKLGSTWHANVLALLQLWVESP